MTKVTKKTKYLASSTPEELAAALNLPTSTSLEWKVRFQVTNEIIRSFQKSNLTITAFAERSETSRARITRILKKDTTDISLDVLFRVLGAIGRQVELKFLKAG